MNALVGHHAIVDYSEDGKPCYVQVRIIGYDDGTFMAVDASGHLTAVSPSNLLVKGDNLHQLYCDPTCDTLPCNRPAPPEEVPAVNPDAPPVVDADPVV